MDQPVALPRQQDGASPQRLLATLLGEYFPPDVQLSSAAVVAMLAPFGISEASARTALSRIIRRGLVTASRSGREATYGLSAEARDGTAHRRELLLGFGSAEPAWTGDWTAVAFSLADGSQADRHRLRRELGQAGFVRLVDSMWIRPGVAPADVLRPVHDLATGPGAAVLSVMTVRFPDESGPTGPARAFDLGPLRARYEAFIDDFGPVVDRAGAGRVDAGEALDCRTRLMDAWRGFPQDDPRLPAALLPPDWPLSRARDVFLVLHRLLGPPAAAHLRAVLADAAPEVAALVTHYVSDDEPAVSR